MREAILESRNAIRACARNLPVGCVMVLDLIIKDGIASRLLVPARHHKRH